MSFSQAQHAFIMEHHYFAPQSYAYVQGEFQEISSNVPVPHCSTVIDHFQENGGVNNKYSRRPCVLTNEKM
jgi:hypothetical protein